MSIGAIIVMTIAISCVAAAVAMCIYDVASAVSEHFKGQDNDNI